MKRARILLASLTLISASMTWSAAAGAVSSPKVAASTQTFTGGGTGVSGLAARWLYWAGRYTSSGQLGSGSYDVGGIGSTVAKFTRSDGMTMTGTFGDAPSPNDCGTVDPAIECAHADLVGTADIASAHLVLSIAKQEVLDGGTFKSAFLMRGTLGLRRRIGYAMVDANGSTYMFGGIDPQPSVNTPDAVDLELNRTGDGGWIATRAGAVYTIGNARAFNDPNRASPALATGERVTSLSPTPTDQGYWLFTSRGRALPFGDAVFHGDLRASTLNGEIVGSIASPTGKGYYMVGSDGGVFAFGDAKFRGSMGNARLNRPVVGLVPTADNTGYWLVASDGGVFSFHAPFRGSMGAVALNRPIVTMVPYAGAYLMVASDGGVFNFSNGLFFGSEGGTRVPAPIVNAASTH